MPALEIDISALLDAAHTELVFSDPHPIAYSDAVDLASNRLPSTLKTGRINVYALWVRAKGRSDWQLMYIGQRSARSGWSRVAQHLFATPKGTQSKLDSVREALNRGDCIGVTAILVTPDSMRLAVEEELIARNAAVLGGLPWNIKGKAKR